MKFLHLNFLPRSADLALLVLRVWFGGSILWLHGRDKLMHFSAYAGQFADPFGVGKTPSLALVVFAELVCSALVVLGLFTRVAALVVAFAMGVAFYFAHGAKLSGPGSGEMAFLYVGAFVTLFFAGAGRFSVDAKIGAKA